jgi:predicted TIM-barrel fold metal-dependent hydrolase
MGTASSSFRAIDTVPHIFDAKRAIGTPYAPDPQGVTASNLRERAPEGVVGTIVVEASPWLEDNLWLLSAVEPEPFVVGVVGNLRPGDERFPEYVERYSKHPLYLGIRHGKIWPGYDLPGQLKSPAFMDGLRLLAEANLALDLGNPRLDLLQAAVRINDAVPELRLIVDHLGMYPGGKSEESGLEPVLREYAQRPNIFGKFSGIPSGNPEASAAQIVAANRDRLDRFYEAFGAERAIGGGYFSTKSLAIFDEFLAGRSAEQREEFFWRASARAYRWVPRMADQPALGK